MRGLCPECSQIHPGNEPCPERENTVEIIDIETSTEINELATALAKAQGDIKPAAEVGENPHFKSKYATLASVWDACREPLSTNGIAVIQLPFNSGDGEIGIVTRVCHSSGQWVQGRLCVKPAKFDPQGAGSVITYLRRYMLASFAGVAPGDDDDGNAASLGEPGAPKTQHETPADLWGGPLNKTAFKKAMMAFCADVEGCEDDDSLTALLNMAQSQVLMEQCINDMPTWFYGQDGSDVIGLETRIDRARDKFSNAAVDG
jgi:hypothetical protein